MGVFRVTLSSLAWTEALSDVHAAPHSRVSPAGESEPNTVLSFE